MLTTEELEDALRAGYEGRSIEFKGPGRSDDKSFLAKVARGCLSMGNLRDGGHVVVGIDGAKPQEMLPGLSPNQTASWRAYDDVSARLAEYADPPLQFELALLELVSGAEVVALRVYEFADIPHMCAKDFPDVLRKGAVYVRSHRMPQTAEIASSVEMRELLDLAAEKRLRSYVETADRAGLRLSTDAGNREREAVDAREQFGAELRRAWE